MKKIKLPYHAVFTALLCLGVAHAAWADTDMSKMPQGMNAQSQNATSVRGPQGFQGANGYQLMTVAQVLDQGKDEMRVTLRGTLTEFLGKDRYSFTDGTGTVEIELDDDYDWSHLSRGELIQIEGEVDKDFLDFVIEVDRAYSLEKDQERRPISASFNVQDGSATPYIQRLDFEDYLEKDTWEDAWDDAEDALSDAYDGAADKFEEWSDNMEDYYDDTVESIKKI